MASIIGEKSKYRNAVACNKYRWNNATSADLAALDDQIIAAQAELVRVNALLTRCLAGGVFYSCHKKLGRSESGLKTDVAAITANIASLKTQRANLAESISTQLALSSKQLEVAQQNTTVNKSIAETDSLQSAATTSKVVTYVLIGAVVVGVIIGGIVLFKKFKKH